MMFTVLLTEQFSAIRGSIFSAIEFTILLILLISLKISPQDEEAYK